MARKLSPWVKEVKKAMIDKDMDDADVAEKCGLSKVYVHNIVNGKVYSEPAIKKIEMVLGITDGSYTCLM